MAKPIRIKINHAKLQQQTFSYPRNMPYSLIKKELQRDNILSIFNNYYFQVAELPIIYQSDFEQVRSDPKDIHQFDLVFQHYNYATALYHFRAVAQLLKSKHKIYTIFKGNHKNQLKTYSDLDIQVLTAELVPEGYRDYQWNIEKVLCPNYNGDLQQREGVDQLVQFI